MAQSRPSKSSPTSGNPQCSPISHIQDFISIENGTSFFSMALKRSFNFNDDGAISEPPENVVRETFAIFPQSPATIFIETKGDISPSYGNVLAVTLAEYIQPFLEEVICIIPVITDITENYQASQVVDLREKVLEEFNKKYPLQFLLMTPAKSRNMLRAAQVAMAVGAFLIRQRERTGKVDRIMEKTLMRRLRSARDDSIDAFEAIGRLLFNLNLTLPSPRLALSSYKEGKKEELGNWTHPTHLRCNECYVGTLDNLLQESGKRAFERNDEEHDIIVADVTTKSEFPRQPQRSQESLTLAEHRLVIDTMTQAKTDEQTLASSSAGSRQTPPPSTPSPPMTSQEDNTKSSGHAASGEEGRKGRRKMNIQDFDKVYNKKGKVLCFPDFVEHKVTLYKKVTPARPPRPADADVEASSQEKDGDASKKQQPKIRRKEPSSYVLDEEKMKNPNILEHLDVEYCEFLVVQRIKEALEEIADSEDPPVFLFHNQNLSSKAGEMDVLVLHPYLGVLLLEIRHVKNKDAFFRFDDATAQLLHAKDSIQEEMGDLLEKDAIVLTIALPKLEPEDSSDIRHNAQERLSAKPASDVSAATSTSPMMSSPIPTREKQSGRKSEGGRGDRASKIKEGAMLGKHPEIRLLCGSTSEVIVYWVRRLQHLRATGIPAFKGSTEEERVLSFKEACIRHLCVASLRPGHSVKASADLHHRFLLIEEHLRARDSRAELLHISGPFKSGKTLLLAKRARRWLRESRRLALAVGGWDDVLLRHLSESVCGEKADVARVSTHNNYRDLLECVATISTDDPISIIVDEARFSFSGSYHYSRLLDQVTAGRVRGLWTAHTSPLSDELERKLQSLGGSSVQLTACLRCPPHVMAWTHSMRGTDAPPLLPPPVPVTRELGVEVEVISHPDHRPSQSWRTCRRCIDEVTAFFSSLGLQDQRARSALSLSDVVVLTIDPSCDTEAVAAWLCRLGLHAVAERLTWRYDIPVLPPGVAPTSPDHAEEEAARQRILKGKDVTGRPAIHVLWYRDFRGLERKVVLLWHEDEDDEDRDRQTQERKARMSWHRDLWFYAASRCQGRLAVMVATPSPALSLLPATSPPKSQRPLPPVPLQ